MDGKPNMKCTMDNTRGLKPYTCEKFRSNSGAVCSSWTKSEDSSVWIQKYSGWTDNFCRNPRNAQDTKWCYTTDDYTNSELCY